LRLRYAALQTRPSPYGLERRMSPNGDAHIRPDIETGRTGMRTAAACAVKT
jgi:hypothetical protein